MKIEMSRKEEIILSLIISATVGAFWSGLFGFSSGYGPDLNLLRNDLLINEGQAVSAQSLNEAKSSSYTFPPPMYVFEWIEFEVNIYNASGGVLQMNFSRDDEILRTELVSGSARIVLSGYGEYRLRNSNIDVTLQAMNEDARIGSIYININRGTREYNPLTGALSLTIMVAVIIVLFAHCREK